MADDDIESIRTKPAPPPGPLEAVQGSLVVLALLGVGVLFGIARYFPPFGFGLLLLGTLAVLGYAHGDSRWLLVVLGCAFFARLLVVGVDASLGVLPQPPVGSEHHGVTMALIEAWGRGEVLDPELGVSYMRRVVAHLLAPFYVLFGPVQLSGRIAIAAYGTLVGYPTFRLAAMLADRRTAMVATVAVLFWPSFLYRSVLLQREVVIVLAMLTILWLAVRWVDEFHTPDLLLFVPALWLVYALREQNLVIVAAVVGVALLVRRQRSVLYWIAGLVGIGLGWIFISGWFEQLRVVGDGLSPRAIDAYAHNRAHGDGAYLVDLHYRSWLDIVLVAPVKAVYYLFSPFPWQVNGITGILAGLSGFAVFLACIAVPLGIRRLVDRPDRLAVVLTYLIVGVFAYAIVEMNYGAAFRRRIQFVPIVLILASVGLSHVRVSLFPAERGEEEPSTAATTD